MAEIDKYLGFLRERNGSDLHLTSGNPPMIRLYGSMTPLKGDSLKPEQVEKLLTEIMPERKKQQFDEQWDTDFGYELPGVARFRVNIFRDRYGMGGVFRLIPNELQTLEDLGTPPVARRLCELSKGLVLVTGPTGSGKSTTLAAMIDYINDSRKEHIITIEDPIEFVHGNKKCLVNQREVDSHTVSFRNALRAALREDPDIVLVGEMRDLETTHIAIETAETGHLVFGTLHTTTAASTVDRLIDQFSADRQNQIRTMLSISLKAVISQTLLRRRDGKGRIAAFEVLGVTPAVANNIREGKTYQIPSSMQTGGKEGMIMLNDAMLKHVISGIVDPPEVVLKSINKDDMRQKLRVAGFSGNW